jgi:hypothetical protein
MNRFVLGLLLALLALLALGAVWGQGDDLIGVWEMGNVDENGDVKLYVYEFRADGIWIQNEYYEDELECVYVLPYEVDGNVITVGEGLNWEIGNTMWRRVSSNSTKILEQRLAF